MTEIWTENHRFIWYSYMINNVFFSLQGLIGPTGLPGTVGGEGTKVNQSHVKHVKELFKICIKQ